MAEAVANEENVCPLSKAVESMNLSQPADDESKPSIRSVETVKELQKTLMTLVKQATNNQPTNAPTSPDRVLLKGIIEAGEESYDAAINSFKQALELCSQPDTEISEDGVNIRPYLSDVGKKEVQLNCLNQIGICLSQLGQSKQSSDYFKKAMEGYMGDKELIAHVYDRYTKLMMNQSTGPTDAPTDNPEATEEQGEENSLGTAEDVPSGTPPEEVQPTAEPEDKQRQAPPSATGEHFNELPEEETWYPVTQDELLEYSCTYLEMMIFGAQLMFQQHPFVQPSSSTTPVQPVETPVDQAAAEPVE